MNWTPGSERHLSFACIFNVLNLFIVIRSFSTTIDASSQTQPRPVDLLNTLAFKNEGQLNFLFMLKIIKLVIAFIFIFWQTRTHNMKWSRPQGTPMGKLLQSLWQAMVKRKKTWHIAGTTYLSTPAYPLEAALLGCVKNHHLFSAKSWTAVWF